MVKFVWLDAVNGGRVPVNPDQVQYVRQFGGQTELVFGALPGGFHTLAVLGDGEVVTALLERPHGDPSLMLKAIAAAQSPQPSRADRRRMKAAKAP